jgi:ankyrin repeat protein
MEVDALNALHQTALFVAAQWGKLEVMEMLLKLGANVNRSDKDGNTALLKVRTRARRHSTRAVPWEGA